ncbi:MAG: hypothetical protein ASARMPRED_003540 [Alectoria sarmentosa]|nr:MAG: hypothetical protein ASARMPRED_003540 [Alectoria sarmentosa]
MALQLVDSCVYFLSRGGFITYGVGRTLESLIYPTTYGGDNAELPYPAWVWEPDGTAEFVAIPSNPATDEYIQGTKAVSEISGYNDAEQPGEDTRWAREQSGPPTPIPVNVKYACEATLGSPSTANCEAALFEFLQSGEVILDPASGPIIKISAPGLALLAAQPSVRQSVLEEEVNPPAKDRQVRSHSVNIHSKETYKSQEMLQVAFPPTFEIAVYLQPPFNGPADATCPWGVVASHQGDVRSCPVNYVPVRPPERNLGMNATLAGNLTGPIISASSLNVTANYTSNVASVVPFKLPIAAREPCIESSLDRVRRNSSLLWYRYLSIGQFRDYGTMRTIICAIATILAALALAVAQPSSTSAVYATVTPPSSYYLKSRVVAHGHNDKHGLYVSNYHTGIPAAENHSGAGTADLTLQTIDFASPAFFNCVYQEFNLDPP